MVRLAVNRCRHKALMSVIFSVIQTALMDSELYGCFGTLDRR